MDIGSQLKKIRLEKKYTLAEVASRLNISVSLLSQIENTKTDPSMKSLGDLLRFYAVNFSDFFRQIEQTRHIFIKSSETETIVNSEFGFTLTLLASKLENNTLETFLVELNPGSVLEVATLNIEINGERLIYIMNGSVEAIIDGAESFIMGEGDSLNFKSFVPCRIKNNGKVNSKILISGMPPVIL